MKLQSIQLGFFLTIRWLKRGRKGLVITPIIIIAIIYINLLFIPGLIESAKTLNQEQVRNTFISDIQIRPNPQNNDIHESQKILKRIRSLNDVQAATATYQVANRILAGSEGGYWTVLAIDPVSYQQVFQHQTIDGTFLDRSDNNAIYVGALIAGNSYESQPNFESTLGGLGIDQDVTVTLYNSGDRTYQVKGVFKDKFYDSDIRAFIPAGAYVRDHPEAKGKATSISVKAANEASVTDLSKTLSTTFPELEVFSAEELSGNFTDQINTYHSINLIISAMSLFVAAITVFVLTYIDLIQRRRHIGVQRAIGIQQESIISHYIFRAIFLTTIGVVTGGIIYRVLLVEYFNAQPFSLAIGDVKLASIPYYYVLYAGILVVIAIISALIPTLISVRMKIFDTIWGTDS